MFALVSYLAVRIGIGIEIRIANGIAIPELAIRSAKQISAIRSSSWLASGDIERMRARANSPLAFHLNLQRKIPNQRTLSSNLNLELTLRANSNLSSGRQIRSLSCSLWRICARLISKSRTSFFSLSRASLQFGPLLALPSSAVQSFRPSRPEVDSVASFDPLNVRRRSLSSHWEPPSIANERKRKQRSKVMINNPFPARIEQRRRTEEDRTRTGQEELALGLRQQLNSFRRSRRRLDVTGAQNTKDN